MSAVAPYCNLASRKSTTQIWNQKGPGAFSSTQSVVADEADFASLLEVEPELAAPPEPSRHQGKFFQCCRAKRFIRQHHPSRDPDVQGKTIDLWAAGWSWCLDRAPQYGIIGALPLADLNRLLALRPDRFGKDPSAQTLKARRRVLRASKAMDFGPSGAGFDHPAGPYVLVTGLVFHGEPDPWAERFYRLRRPERAEQQRRRRRGGVDDLPPTPEKNSSEVQDSASSRREADDPTSSFLVHAGDAAQAARQALAGLGISLPHPPKSPPEDPAAGGWKNESSQKSRWADPTWWRQRHARRVASFDADILRRVRIEKRFLDAAVAVVVRSPQKTTVHPGKRVLRLALTMQKTGLITKSTALAVRAMGSRFESYGTKALFRVRPNLLEEEEDYLPAAGGHDCD